ncbi:MAG: hypothetical protein EKK41_22680 [Hyphomicrobiales bacterium]|nr:MAG: hypothetical protein EKK41_22680 [Hyphomicrobiales bacterium]
MDTTRKLGVALATFATLFAGGAQADGLLRGSLKDSPSTAKSACSYTSSVELTSDYMFRGYSQSAGHPALQGEVEATCGRFYAGVWASSLDWNAASTTYPALPNNNASLEVDLSVGIKPVTGPITWDFGLVYYAYPGSRSFTVAGNNDYLELKAGASASPWKDATLGATVFYSPDYQHRTGSVWTFEGSLAQVLPKVDRFTPTVNAVLGYQVGNDGVRYAALFGNGESSYLYWNAGVTFAYEKWSLDLRYWDTNLSGNAGGSAYCRGTIFQCDDRYVATLKLAY